MKIRIEIVEGMSEDEVIIRCGKISERIQEIEHFISEIASKLPTLILYKNGNEFYLPTEDILFFQTETDSVYAHTADDVYQVKQRLYELEDILPHDFIRISKSTILNIRHILSINRNLTSSSLVKFYKSHKQVYVSRYYFKNLRERLEERRLR